MWRRLTPSRMDLLIIVPAPLLLHTTRLQYLNSNILLLYADGWTQYNKKYSSTDVPVKMSGNPFRVIHHTNKPLFLSTSLSLLTILVWETSTSSNNSTSLSPKTPAPFHLSSLALVLSTVINKPWGRHLGHSNHWSVTIPHASTVCCDKWIRTLHSHTQGGHLSFSPMLLMTLHFRSLSLPLLYES